MIDNIAALPQKDSRDIPSVDIDRIHELSLNGLLIYPKHESPGCWDATCEIRPDEVTNLMIIHGSVSASGFGKVRIQLPLDKVNDHYIFQIEPKGAKQMVEIVGILEKNGWDWADGSDED